MNGVKVIEVLSDPDVVELWHQGLQKDPLELKGYFQNRLPSGVIRIVFNLKTPVTLATFVQASFFNYSKVNLNFPHPHLNFPPSKLSNLNLRTS